MSGRFVEQEWEARPDRDPWSPGCLGSPDLHVPHGTLERAAFSDRDSHERARPVCSTRDGSDSGETAGTDSGIRSWQDIAGEARVCATQALVEHTATC